MLPRALQGTEVGGVSLQGGACGGREDIPGETVSSFSLPLLGNTDPGRGEMI